MLDSEYDITGLNPRFDMDEFMSPPIAIELPIQSEPIVIQDNSSISEANAILEVFGGNQEVYAAHFTQIRDGELISGFAPHKGQVTAQMLVDDHFTNKRPLGFYVIKGSGSTQCNVTCVDIDNKGDSNPTWRSQVADIVFAVRALGLEPIIEMSQSGSGCHVWLRCQNWPAFAARALWLKVESTVGFKFLEIFPKQSKLEDGKLGNLVRYPRSGKSAFYNIQDDRSWTPLCFTSALSAKCVEWHQFLDIIGGLDNLTELQVRSEQSVTVCSAPTDVPSGVPATIAWYLQSETTAISHAWDCRTLQDKSSCQARFSMDCCLAYKAKGDVPALDFWQFNRAWCEFNNYPKGSTDSKIGLLYSKQRARLLEVIAQEQDEVQPDAVQITETVESVDITSAPEFKEASELFSEHSRGSRLAKHFCSKDIPVQTSVMMAMSVISAKLGNMVYVQTNKGVVYPNVFMTFLGDTSDGKDVCFGHLSSVLTSTKTINTKMVTDESGVEHEYYITDTVRNVLGTAPTRAGLFDDLCQTGFGMHYYSEYSDHMRENNPHSPETDYKELLTAHTDDWRPSHLNKKNQYVHFPAPSRVAFTQFSRLLSDVTRDRMDDGSLPRHCFIVLPKEPLDSKLTFDKTVDIERLSLIELLDEMVVFAYSRKQQTRTEKGELSDGKIFMEGLDISKDYRHMIEVTDEAKEVLNIWRVEKRKSLLVSLGSNIEMFCKKMTGEYLIKFAMIMAFANQRNDEVTLPVIGRDAAESAIKVLNHLIEFQIFIIDSCKKQTHEVAIILNYLEKMTEPVTYRQMKKASKAIRDMDSSVFFAICDETKDKEMKINTKGKTTTYERIR